MGDAVRVVVVGAGIVGAAVAEALALDGAHVTVVDRGLPGGGDTANGMGHVVVMNESPPQGALAAWSRRLWEARLETLPGNAELTRCGTIWIAADDRELRELRRRRDGYAALGVTSHLLDARELYDAEPQLSPGLAGGLLVPGDVALHAPPVAAAMLETVRRRGGSIRLNENVRSIAGNAVVLDGGRTLACDYAVNAAGVAAAALTPDIQTRPRKGHLAVTDRRPGLVRHQLIELAYSGHTRTDDATSVAFNVQPRASGQILIGSSRQLGVDSRAVDPDVLSRMFRRACEFLPVLQTLPVARTWAGQRAASPDGLPLIGPHPQDPRLLLATGHEGLGLTTSLGTAQLVADTVAGRPSAIPHRPYLPERLDARQTR